MWNKIKKALALIGGGLIAVLFFVLRIKKNKIDEIEEELNLVKEELESVEEVHQVEEKLEEVSQKAEEKTENRISEVKTETIEMLVEEVKIEDTGKKYNELIGNWNNEGT